MPDVLKPFAPSFEGTMKVETAEDEEGYIMLRGQPPPNYRQTNAWGGNNAKGKAAAARRSYKRQHSSLQYRDPLGPSRIACTCTSYLDSLYLNSI